MKLHGKQHEHTVVAANNYAATLKDLRRYEEAKALLRQSMPVARRLLGESHELTLRMNWNYAWALYMADGAKLRELREAVATLEDTERTARRVLGGTHPLTVDLEVELQYARAALRARETPSGSS